MARIVCVSDTHTYHDHISMPPGDILIHAGDFTFSGRHDEVCDFNRWLGKLPYRHKIVICGNHEVGIQRNPKLAELLTNCIYLLDREVTVEGLRIYGSPWTPVFGSWAFMKSRGRELKETWAKIPTGLDLLVTHGPPFGVLDMTPPYVAIGYPGASVSRAGENVGDQELREAILEKRPRVFVCGHIHHSYGQAKLGGTHCINAATCSEAYSPDNPPVVMDL